MAYRDQPLGELALSIPRASALFRKYDMDYCCGGKQTLARAAARKELDVEVIEAELAKLAEQPIEKDWRSAPLAEIIDHIIVRYHDRHREQLPELILQATKVERVHADKPSVPKGLTFSCICLLGGVVMLYVNPSVIGAFTMITTVSAILFMFVWTIILCSYLVYRKQRPHLHEKSIYKMPLGKLMCWVCMAFFVFVVVLLTLEDDTRQALLVTPLWFIALGLGWLFIGKKRAAELRK